MSKILKLVALALAGYIIYELISRYMAERAAAPAAGPSAETLGRIGGAAMTAGGQGQVQRTLGPDGSSASERVGRGVVRRENRQEI